MQPLIVSSVYSTLSVNKRRLCIDSKIDGIHEEYPAFRCPFDLIVLNNPHGLVTLEALRFCTKTNIGIAVLDWTGNLLCTLLPRDTISPKLRLQQYKKAIDEEAKYRMASAILNTKIDKSLELLLKLAEYYPVLNKEEIRKSFGEMRAKFRNSHDLLNLEGNISIIYWSYFKKVFDVIAPKIGFPGRNSRNRSWNQSASDPGNACLNLAYGVAEAEVRRLLTSIGFDLSISCGLHELLHGRDSLVFDVLELIRYACDLSVVQLFEQGVKLSDFITTENYFVRLRPETVQRLVTILKVNLNTKSNYKGRNCTLENVFYSELRNLVDFLMEKRSTLTFSMPEIQIRRNDDLILREKLLKMTPDERKQRGIRRNTLWYQQKAIREGKKIKIYAKIVTKLK